MLVLPHLTLRKLRLRGTRPFAEDHTDLNLAPPSPDVWTAPPELWASPCFDSGGGSCMKLHRDMHVPRKAHHWGWWSHHQPRSGCHRPPLMGSSSSVAVSFFPLSFLSSLLPEKKNPVALLSHNHAHSGVLAHGWWLSWIKTQSLSHQLNLMVSVGSLGSRPWSNDLSPRFHWEGAGGQIGRGIQKWHKGGEEHYWASDCGGRLSLVP